MNGLASDESVVIPAEQSGSPLNPCTQEVLLGNAERVSYCKENELCSYSTKEPADPVEGSGGEYQFCPTHGRQSTVSNISHVENASLK